MKYRDADVHVVFHRGLSDNMKQRCVDFYNSFPCLQIDEILGGFESFSIYDDCDMHIGFRVHAHIYNLSHGNVSYIVVKFTTNYGGMYDKRFIFGVVVLLLALGFVARIVYEHSIIRYCILGIYIVMLAIALWKFRDKIKTII